ncbi:hypothetical protein DL765_001898 [Monosporascus sp. GIB2]|nr:hypothetical protein DL765_001898 [Monosporascus sp. GIB2]
MDMHDMSAEVTAADTAAEVATDAAASDPANRTQKKTSQTCITCRARKVRCDGRRDVCQNCERLGFTCSFQDKSSPHPDTDSITSFSLPRRRVRLACINCHSRKARCSGETPKCARCQAQGIDCVYRPTKRSGGVNGTAIAAGSSVHSTSQQAGATDSEHESVTSEPPEKRAMLRRDENGSHHGRGVPDNNQHYDLTGPPIPRRLGNDPYGSSFSLACVSLEADRHHRFKFPDEALILKAFNNYFRHVHHVPVLSFIHRASLMQRYHAGMMDKALLLAIVGITSLLTDLGPGTREYGNRCVDECQQMIYQDLENPSTLKIQALVLIMKHRMLSRRFTGAFMLAAIGARFAYALRLNYENPNLCFLARESRRRLMWAFCTIDSGINGGYSDFTLLPPESMHIQLPCNERNFEFDLPQVTEFLRPIPTKPFPDDVGSLLLHVRLLWMRSRVLYCTKNVLAMSDSELTQLPELVKVLADELRNFHEFLPASFKFSDSNLQLRAYSPRLCVFIMIHVWWRQCHCDLFRIILPGIKESLPRSAVDRLDPQFVAMCARQCYEHAIGMSDIFRSILALDGGLPVTDLDLAVCAYQCARVLYSIYRTRGVEYQLSADDIVERAQRCLAVAKAMNHIPAGAAVVTDLESLIARGFAPGTPSRPCSPNLVSRQTLFRHNPVYQMQIVDDTEVANMPIPSPLNHTGVPSPYGTSVHTPNSNATPVLSHPRPRGMSMSAEMALGDQNMPKPNLPPVVPPDGLDNNNAFEGAMDGFDFNFESFGNTGLDAGPWFSNDWLNNDFPQMTV